MIYSFEYIEAIQYPKSGGLVSDSVQHPQRTVFLSFRGMCGPGYFSIIWCVYNFSTRDLTLTLAKLDGLKPVNLLAEKAIRNALKW